MARPATGAVLSDPPTAAGGIVVNWIDGSTFGAWFRQLVTEMQLTIRTSARKNGNEYLDRGREASTHSGRARSPDLVMRARAPHAYVLLPGERIRRTDMTAITTTPIVFVVDHDVALRESVKSLVQVSGW